MADAFTGLFVAGFIVVLWSTLYRENKLYDIVQYGALGSYFGYSSYVILKTLWDKTFIPLLTTAPDISLIIVTIMGFVLLLRIIPRFGKIARIPLGLYMGISMAVAVRGSISPQIIKQLEVQSLYNPSDLFGSLNNIIIALCVLSTILYFIMSIEPKGAHYQITRFGRIAIMLSFGAIWGTSFMGYVSYSITQVASIVTGYGIYVSLIAIIIIAADIIYARTKTKKPIEPPK